MIQFKCLVISDTEKPYQTFGQSWKTSQNFTHIFHKQKIFINSGTIDVTFVVVDEKDRFHNKTILLILAASAANQLLCCKNTQKVRLGLSSPSFPMKRFNRRSFTKWYFELSKTSMMDHFCKNTPRKKWPYSELLWSVFSPNAGKYGLE